MYGSAGLHARGKLRELGRELDAVEIEHEAMRMLQRRPADARSDAGDSRIDARVFLRRPQPRRRDAARRCAHATPAQRAAPPARRATGSSAPALERNAGQPVAAAMPKRASIAARHRSPRSVCARSVSSRPASCGSPDTRASARRPAGGSSPATRSGHSTRQTASSRKQSARPAVSHSLDRRTDKNQSDRSISSKTNNVQPTCRSGS